MTKTGAKEFVEAAERGDLDLLKAFLPLVESVDVEYEADEVYYGRTALMMAAAKNHVECVRFLLENGADPNQKDKFENTSLDYAAREGAAECFHLLFEKVDAENKNLERLMHLTAEKGKAKELQFLIEKGAKPETLQEWNENSCLHLAAVNKNTECLELLLQTRFDVNARNRWKGTALHHAAQYGGVAHLQLLVRHGVDATATDEFGKTALHCAAEYGRAENCEFLLKSIPIDCRDNEGETPLMWAAGSCEEDAPRVIEFLLENGAETQLEDLNGWNCLHHAAANGHLESVKVLCDRVPLESKTKEGKTALQVAEECKRTELADFLAERTQGKTKSIPRR